MTIRPMEGGASDRIPVNYVLVSVFDKTGLDTLVPGLLEVNPNVMFMSSTGSYTALEKIMGADAAKDHLMQVSDYTEFPEMQGGLVKTLHPKIHAGILGERNNPEHQEYLKNLAKTPRFIVEYVGGEMCIGTDVHRVFDAKVGGEYRVEIVQGFPGVYIDMVVGNLYPFSKKIAEAGCTFEDARGNIDIGGPAMLRGAGKNFPSCAAVCDPADYAALLQNIRQNNGCTTFEQRLSLMPKVFERTGRYDTEIAAYMKIQAADPAKVRAGYEFAAVPNIGGK